MPQFRIVDLRNGSDRAEYVVIDERPENAAALALGLKLVRAGSPSRLICKAYWQSGDDTNMVRLYQALQDRHAITATSHQDTALTGR